MKLDYLTNKTFAQQDGGKLFHGFFTRKGGVSEGGYASLNCGIGSDDAQDRIATNRARVAGEIGIGSENLLSVYQIHSASCLSVGEIWKPEQRPQADAMVTDKPGIGLGILTADCAPVLFYAFKPSGEPVIGAAHAGWKGALGGVLAATTDEMQKLGADIATIRACVGPCISLTSYEVSSDFCEPFLEEHDEAVRFFRPGKTGRMFFDLPGYCAWRLFRCGIKSVMLLDKDTYASETDFYSYRRMTHRSEKDYGRQISVIAIKN